METCGLNQWQRMTALLMRRLRLDLRGAPGHLLRLASAGIMLLTISASISVMFATGSPGLAAFQSMIWADALIISAASTTVFASAIGAEREAGTLSLLRMTGMTSLSVLLGQGASGLVIGVLLLAVQFPFIVLTITLGGVLWNQVLGAALALLAHLVLCAGLGLFWSVLCQRSGTAAFLTLLSMIALWIGPWGTRELADDMLRAGTISDGTERSVNAVTMWIDRELAWTRLSEISTSLGVSPLWSSQLVTSTGVGIGLFLLSVLIMDRRPIEIVQRASMLATLGRSRRGRAWNRAPIVWKDFRMFMGGERGVILRLIIYPLVPLTCAFLLDAFADAQLRNENYWEAVAWTAVVFLVIECNAVASRLFRNELAEQTWGTLTLTPRPFMSIVAAKLGGAALGLLPGISVAVFASLISDDVRQSWRDGFAQDGELGCILMQPTAWLAATSLSSVLFVSFPPMVLMFCGLVGFFLQYSLAFMSAQTLTLNGAVSMKVFNYGYLFVASSAVAAAYAIALIRLRIVTRRD